MPPLQTPFKHLNEQHSSEKLQKDPSGEHELAQNSPLQKPSQQKVSKPHGAPRGTHSAPPHTPPKQLMLQQSSGKKQAAPSGRHSTSPHTWPSIHALPPQHGTVGEQGE